MGILRLVLGIFFLYSLSGCVKMMHATFKETYPISNPIKFFIGNTKSDGVIENRAGKPTARIKTETVGIAKENVIKIEQDLFPEGKKTNHRSWQLLQIDEHHVDATANDIDGTAHGILNGNHFSWTFRLKLQERKFVKHLRMSQNMYLMPDGKSMIIRSVLRKFGFVVVQITEEFQKY